jgi:di/tripeptidase
VGDPSDLARLHGTDERISVEYYTRAVQFFIQLIKNSASAA